VKRLLKWLLGIVSRKIAEDYASGDNDWDIAIERRRIVDGAKRVTA
jgi:hypothetical protein